MNCVHNDTIMISRRIGDGALPSGSMLTAHLQAEQFELLQVYLPVLVYVHPLECLPPLAIAVRNIGAPPQSDCAIRLYSAPY